MWALSVVRGDGSIHTVGDIPISAMPSGTPTPVALWDQDGEQIGTTEGYLTPLSHLPGGMLVHPVTTHEYHRATLIQAQP